MWVGTNYANPFQAINAASARALGPKGLGLEDCVVIIDADVPNNHARWITYDMTLQRVTEAGMHAPIKVMQWSDQIHRNEEGVWCRDVTPGNRFEHQGGWHIAGQCADAPPHVLCSSDAVHGCQKNPAKVKLASNPPMPDTRWWREKGKYVADRYGDIGRANQPHGQPEFILTNEWDESMFSPYIRCANLGLNGWTHAKAWAAYEAIRSNLAAGARAVCPDARFLGPEAAYKSGFEQTLKDESERNGIAYHTATFHAYAIDAPYPEGTLRRLREEFAPLFTRYRSSSLYNNRARITELDAGPEATRGKLVEGLRAIHAEFPWIEGVNLFRMEYEERDDPDGSKTPIGLFAQWPVPEGEAFPRLTPLGVSLQNYIAFELRREQPDLSEVIGMLKAATERLEFLQGRIGK